MLFVSSLIYSLSFTSCKPSFPELPPDSPKDTYVLISQSVFYGKKRVTVDYGTISVPENRGKGVSRLIQLPFIRARALSDSSDVPVFALSGGPGNSNLTWDLEHMLPLLLKHDFIMVGYRGVDGSMVLDCPEVVEALDGSLPLSDESMKKVGKAWKKALERMKSEGIDLDGYTIMETIDDLEAVRKVLGYPRINLLSRSYGTRVAYLYSLRYPESLYRSAMIGVNPPGRFVWESSMIDNQLRQYSELWAANPLMVRKSKDLYESMKGILQKMPEQWMGIPISKDKVRVVAFAMLYHRKTAAMVFDSFVAAERGDASGLAMMSAAFDFVMPRMMIWGDALKAVSSDFDSLRNYNAESQPSEDYPMGSPLNKLLWGPLEYGHLSIKPIPEIYRTHRPTQVETLLLSGNLDFSTPAQYATVELLPFLEKGRQIILSDCGHTADVLNPGVGNAVPLLRAYYENGIYLLPSARYIPMDFTVNWGFPLLAKIVLALAVLVFCLLIYLLTRVIRRYIR